MVKSINQGLEKSIINSLDGEDVELLPHIPYLLKDTREIGASPEDIIKLIRANRFIDVKLEVLDLGCGKGSVSVALAREFDWKITGVDAVPEFIADAVQYAQQEKVADKCRFLYGDAREYVRTRQNFDMIILGSIGPVLGNVLETLKKVQNCLKPKGFVILDDGYVEDINKAEDAYPHKDDFYKQIRRSHFKIIDELDYSDEFMEDATDEIFSVIVKRANELIKKYPSKEKIFLEYIQKQSEENQKLNDYITCKTVLLQL